MTLFKRLTLISAMTALLLLQTGCVLTKILTVPMRVVGAVVSIVPLAGNPAHDGIDAAAEEIDELPF